MRALLQRVSRAEVSADGEELGRIRRGLLVYLGVQKGDGEDRAVRLAAKIAGLRIFEDRHGRMNLDLLSTGGSVLVVSQFTLLADCRRGRRPDFTGAEAPQRARMLYESFIRALEERGIHVESGRFGAHMQVESVNDGPVTIILEDP